MEIIIFILLAIISSFFTKNNMLCCGIFAFCGAKKPNINKLKILGLYNMSRGVNSCGIFNGREVTKGIDHEKRFDDFIANNFIELDKDNHTFIGHTRNSSVGTASFANAHPFSYVIDNKLSNVFAHNGTLKNWHNLAKKYNLKPNNFNVDSDMLGLLVANKKFNVLKDYEGAATFVSQDLVKNNTLILWKGASFYKNTLQEDRSLYALKTKEGTYISSIRESLQAIAGNTDEFIDIPINTLIHMENGEVVNHEIYKRTYKVPEIKTYGTGKSYTPKSKVWNYDGSNISDSITNEEEKRIGGRVYFYNGRYVRNGHHLNGAHRLDKDGVQKKNGKLYFFHKGILLSCVNEEGYKQVVNEIKPILDRAKFSARTGISFDVKKLSKYAAQPVDFLDSEINYRRTTGYYSVNEKYTSNPYEALFARKVVYEFNYGNLEKVKDNEEYWKNFDFKSLDWDNLDEKDWKYYFDKAKEYDKNGFNNGKLEELDDGTPFVTEGPFDEDLEEMFDHFVDEFSYVREFVAASEDTAKKRQIESKCEKVKDLLNGVE